MIKYGAHGFVWLGDWTTDAGNDTIRKAAETGFDLLEIPLLDPENFDAKSHRKVLDETGLEATISLALPREVHMPDNPEGAKKFLRRVFDHMEELGSTYIAGCLGYSLGALTGKPPTEEERNIIVEGLRELAEDAQTRGITLALEACNRYETHLYNTLKDTREAVLADWHRQHATARRHLSHEHRGRGVLYAFCRDAGRFRARPHERKSPWARRHRHRKLG